MKEGQSFGQTTERYIRTMHENVGDENLLDDATIVQKLREYEGDLGVSFKKAEHTEEYREYLITLQKQKAEIMANLQQQIAQLDEVGYDTQPVSEEQIKATVGEVISNIRWGVEQPSMEAFSRKERKAILVAQARVQLEDLYDRQLLEIHVESKATDDLSRQAFEAIEARLERGEAPPGILAEQLVENWLLQTIEDYDLPVRMSPADVYDDVMN